MSLKEFPKSVCNLKNLIYLNIVGNCFSFLPDEIGNLVLLKEFFIGDTVLGTKHFSAHCLKTFPESFGKKKKFF